MSIKILVLDDDEDILIVIDTILSIYHYECCTIKDWEILFEKVTDYQPALILMDINLVGQDGRTLCAQLNSDAKTSSIPIILFSSYYNVADTFMKCKAVDFIKKPFDVKDLLLKIKKHTPEHIQIA